MQDLKDFLTGVAHSSQYIRQPEINLSGLPLQQEVGISNHKPATRHHAWVGDELHMVYECSYLQPLRLQYAHLFTSDTSTMRLFFGQRDSVGCFNFVLDCLKLLAV